MGIFPNGSKQECKNGINGESCGENRTDRIHDGRRCILETTALRMDQLHEYGREKSEQKRADK